MPGSSIRPGKPKGLRLAIAVSLLLVLTACSVRPSGTSTPDAAVRLWLSSVATGDVGGLGRVWGGGGTSAWIDTARSSIFGRSDHFGIADVQTSRDTADGSAPSPVGNTEYSYLLEAWRSTDESVNVSPASPVILLVRHGPSGWYVSSCQVGDRLLH